MKLSKPLLTGLCVWGIGLPALAQDPATTIEIGQLPAIGSHRVSEFATVTLTENHAGAWGDGSFRLFFPDNPDQALEFQATTTATGSAAAGVRIMTEFLQVDVDADDATIDSITITPVAFFRTRLPAAPAFVLEDGDMLRMNRTGMFDGVSLERFELGTLGEIVGLEIGFEEDLAVGETLVRPIQTDTGENTGPYTAESTDPAIAAAVVDGDTVRVTGLTAGTVHVVVHDALGRQDMMIVNLLEGPAPQGGEPDVTGPEEDAAAPAATASLAPDSVADLPPFVAGTSSGQDDADDTAQGTDGAEGSARTDSGAGGGTAGASVPGPVPSLDSGDLPAARQAATGSGLSETAAQLPRLSAPAVLGGGTTSAIITAGATTDGSSFRTSFQAGERVLIEGEVLPEPAQVNEAGQLFVVVRVRGADGGEAWFFKNGEVFAPWDGNLASLRPARTTGSLGVTERLRVFQGPLRAGEYAIFLGYLRDGDTLIYSDEPLRLSVGG